MPCESNAAVWSVAFSMLEESKRPAALATVNRILAAYDAYCTVHAELDNFFGPVQTPHCSIFDRTTGSFSDQLVTAIMPTNHVIPSYEDLLVTLEKLAWPD